MRVARHAVYTGDCEAPRRSGYCAALPSFYIAESSYRYSMPMPGSAFCPNPACPVTEHVLDNEAESSRTEDAPGHTSIVTRSRGKPRTSKTLHQFDVLTKTDHYFLKLWRGEGGVWFALSEVHDSRTDHPPVPRGKCDRRWASDRRTIRPLRVTVKILPYAAVTYTYAPQCLPRARKIRKAALNIWASFLITKYIAC